MAEEDLPYSKEAVVSASVLANSILAQSNDQDTVSVPTETLQILANASTIHPPFAATVQEINRIRDIIEHALANPDEPLLPIEELHHHTVTLSREDLYPILGLLLLEPKLEDR